MSTACEQLTQFILAAFPMHPVKAAEISALFREQHFSKGDYLLRAGQYCNDYHFLVSGQVRSYLHNLEGQDVTTGFFQAGGVVCDLFSLFKRVPTHENLHALTDIQCLTISFSELQEAFHTRPEFREFGRSILVNAYAQLKTRMLSMMQETAEQRYAHLLRQNPDIFLHAPLKHIATYLGVTDTSLSRIRKEFARQGKSGEELAK